MPYLGAHESISGGLYRAFEHIRAVGGEALQIFTRNQRQWHAAPLAEEEISLFQEKWEASGRMPVASHASYLINLGSSDAEQAGKSVASFTGELERCDLLGIPYAIIHPGSHGGAGVDQGLSNVAQNLDRVFKHAGGSSQVKVLLETTAGQGTGLGSSFEEIARIIDSSSFPERLGVCLDTCHVFAGGYDLRTPEVYRQTFEAFDRHIGLERLCFFHLNDAKKELGSRVDRHEHIGKGHIGMEGFRLLLNDSRFAEHPMTLETPKGKDLREDIENLKILRSLLRKK